MEKKETTGRSLRWLMAVPLALLLLSVLVEAAGCHRAQQAIRAELNDTIELLAVQENNLAARQDTIRRLEQINIAMAQPLLFAADQRAPGALLLLSAVAYVAVALYYRRREQPAAVCPEPADLLCGIHLTPMQRQLIDLLASSPTHQVPKRDLCQALWGGKDNAEESLYTLVRRTKKAVAETGVEIVCNRGESYELRLTQIVH